MNTFKHAWADNWIRLSICLVLIVVGFAFFGIWSLFVTIPLSLIGQNYGIKLRKSGFGPSIK